MLSRQHISFEGVNFMAWLAAAFGCTVSYIDSGSNVVSREYMMDESITTFDDASTAALALIADIVPATDAALPQYRVFQTYNEGTLVLPTNVQVENCASLTLQLAGAGNKKGNLNLPAPKNALFVSATTGPQNNIVNMGAALVTGFTDNFLAAGKFTISDGEKITRGLSGKRVHKRSNKG